MGCGPESSDFATVYAAELAAIRERRRRVGSALSSAAATADSPPETSVSETDERAESRLSREQQLRRDALAENLVGLSFSGGGIRSATFNLGVLQGLADRGLLTQIDYLSTVSGGGYIGGWLAAWIQREGEAANVESQLQSSRLRQAQATRGSYPRGEVFDSEPEPIHHLRAYSNYLTPVLGLFSADAWVLGTIYLRNLLLNLLVLVPFLMSLILFERLLALVFMKTTDSIATGAWERGAWIAGVLLLLAMLCVILVWLYRSLMQVKGGVPAEGRAWQFSLERRYMHLYILIPTTIISILFTWFSFGHARMNEAELSAALPGIARLVREYPWMLDAWFPFVLSGLVMAFVVGTFHTIYGFDQSTELHAKSFLAPLGLRIFRVILGLLTGFSGGILLYGVFYVFHNVEPRTSHAAIVALTFGPPLFLGAMVLIAFLQVGLISRLWNEAIREWWASLTGATMIYVCAWLVIVGLSIWGPWLILRIELTIHWIDTALLTFWSSAMVGGLMTARKSRVAGTRSHLWLKLLPYVFVVGLIILTSFAADYFVPPIGISHSSLEYLESLEQQHVDVLSALLWGIAALLLFTLFASMRIDVNCFGLHALYKNRLVRCYLGASRPKADQSDGSRKTRGAPTNVKHSPPRSPNPITGFDPRDDLPLDQLSVDSIRRSSALRQRLAARIDELRQRMADLSVHPWWLRCVYRLQYRWELASLEAQLRSLLEAADYLGPFPILCAALNLVQGQELAWQERKAESFVMTPLYCGSATTGYSPTDEYSGGLSLGAAMAISGAAVSPNMGYHTTGPLTALLAIFNMRLGAWLGNPNRSQWRSSGPNNLLKYFLRELLGLTNADDDYVYLSDGGHFENLGMYELIRRRCRYVIVCDSGADPDYAFQDLGGLIRKVRIDFGIEIDIDVHQLIPAGDRELSECHVAVGTIHYGDVDPPIASERSSGNAELQSTFPADRNHNAAFSDNKGLLIYIKPTITGTEPQDVLNYRLGSPLFPHEPTTEQWFSESQFESYRCLGWHIAQNVFAPATYSSAADADAAPGAQASFLELFRHWAHQPKN